jgi:cytoskeletal protein CcmA (bactofilin family)
MKRTVFWIMIILLLGGSTAAWFISSPAVPPRLAANLSGLAVSNWQMIQFKEFDHAFAEPPQQEPSGDKLVLGSSFLLEEGEILEGNLFVLGGTAKLSTNSTVEGDVAILGGTLVVDGVIEGNINAIGGLVSLTSSARVEGDVNTVSAHLDVDEGAQIEGQVNNAETGPFSLVVPGSFKFPNWEGSPPITLPSDIPAPIVNVGLSPLWDALWWIFRSVLWAALAILVALFIPRPIERVGETAMGNPLATGGLGCITVLIAPVILILLAITICLSPVSLIIGFILWIAWGLGIIVLGVETGKRLSGILKVDWAVPVSAGVGTFLLTLVSNGIQLVVPCIGWLVPALIGVVGLGAVLLTRFGSQSYPSAAGLNTENEKMLPASTENTSLTAPDIEPEDQDTEND